MVSLHYFLSDGLFLALGKFCTEYLHDSGMWQVGPAGLCGGVMVFDEEGKCVGSARSLWHAAGRCCCFVQLACRSALWLYDGKQCLDDILSIQIDRISQPELICNLPRHMGQTCVVVSMDFECRPVEKEQTEQL